MNQTELSNLIHRASMLVKSNWLHAVHLLEEARQEYPDNLVILTSLGDIFIQRMLFEKALDYYQQAHALAPDDPQLLHLIGNCYFSINEYKLSLSYLNQIKEPPPEVLYNKALALAFIGSYQESIMVIKQILKVMTDNPFIYFLLIEQYLRIQNYDEAQMIIDVAKRKFGKHPQLLLLSAVVYSKKGMWIKAYLCFSELEAVQPLSSPDHLISYAVSANRIGMYDKAIALLNKARDINPYISGIYEELIRLYLQRGEPDKAKKCLSVAKKYLVSFNPILRLLQERIRNEYSKTTDDYNT